MIFEFQRMGLRVIMLILEGLDQIIINLVRNIKFYEEIKKLENKFDFKAAF